MQRLLELPKQFRLDSGIAPARLPVDVNFWADGENVVFRETEVRSAKGDSRLFATDNPVILLQQAYVTAPFDIERDSRRVYYAENDGSLTAKTELQFPGVYATRTIRSGGSPIISMETFGNFLAATDGRGEVLLFKNTATNVDLVPLMGVSRVKIFKRFGPHLISFGLDDAPERMLWCSADNLEDWDIASPTNSAGDLFLRDLDSSIIAVQKLGLDLAVYGQDSMGVVQYRGAPFYFTFQPRLTGIGAIGINSVVSVSGWNMGVSRSSVWRTNGTDFVFIDQPDMRAFLQSEVNWNRPDDVVGFHDEEESQVKWSYYNNSGELKSVGYNYQTGAWTRYSYGFRAGIERSVFNYPVLGTGISSNENDTGNEGDPPPEIDFAIPRGVYLSGTEDSSNEPAWVQTKPLQLGNEETYARVSKIQVGIKGDSTVSLGAQDTVEEGDLPEFYTTFAAERISTPVEREAQYFVLKFEGTDFRISAIKISGHLGGFIT